MKERPKRESPDWLRFLLQFASSGGLVVPTGQGRMQKGWKRVIRYGFASLVAIIAVGLRLYMNVEMNNDALRMLSVIAVALAAWLGDSDQE